jgi:Uma2 family endonuclease
LGVVVVSVPERQHRFSFEEYAEVAALSDNRVEFWEGAIFDMSGGSPRHSAICSNILRVLGTELRGGPCRVFDANLRVRSIVANRATYADVTIVCGALERDPADKTRQTVLNPSVLIEVQSPSTESDDRGPKLDAYKLIGSVRAVLLVAQDRAEVTVVERKADGSWLHAIVEHGTVEIPELGCRLPLAEVYEDLPEA